MSLWTELSPKWREWLLLELREHLKDSKYDERRGIVRPHVQEKVAAYRAAIAELDRENKGAK